MGFHVLHARRRHNESVDEAEHLMCVHRKGAHLKLGKSWEMNVNATNSAAISEVVAAFLLSDEALSPDYDSLWSDSEEEELPLDPGPMATPPLGYPFTTRPPPPSPAPTEERVSKTEQLRRVERVAHALCERALLMTLQCCDP